MKKLTLAIDQLQVDTFDAGPAGASLGTVRAHDTAPEPIGVEHEIDRKSWDTQCGATICLTCDRTCPSGHTACYTGSAPACCV